MMREAGSAPSDGPSPGNRVPADEPTHGPDGVDLTLIRWMLSLTSRERLDVLQSGVNALRRLRRDDAEG